jgi:His-Xaa-Ser system radical SAM maturase HxsB
MSTYTLLPFNFGRFNHDEYLLTNLCGDYIFLQNEIFMKLVNGVIAESSPEYLDLLSKQFITEVDPRMSIPILSRRFRMKKEILRNFTSLHMVVPTLRCNSSCIYCQVSRRILKDKSTDMKRETARKITKVIFQSPSPYIKIEFQGGDPTLNFDMVKFIITEAEWLNLRYRKKLEFVICTNITLLDEAMVRYLEKHKCFISTSIDGPAALHDKNRLLQNNEDSHHLVEQNLEMIRNIWKDPDAVSALMTTTKYSLGHFREIIDEYIRLGFKEIFLRTLNPYGFAKQYKERISYDIEDFIDNYKEALLYIIEINKKGVYFVEGYAAILLKRILTPFATGFVDLQSPAGVGIAGAIYDYDGSVYVSDEGRMMAIMGNKYFKLGNVLEDDYQSMFNGDKLHHIIEQSCVECLPGCSDCMFQPYCGADPVRNMSEQGDIVGHRPTNEMCRKNKAIIHFLFELIHRNDAVINKIFNSWISR